MVSAVHRGKRLAVTNSHSKPLTLDHSQILRPSRPTPRNVIEKEQSYSTLTSSPVGFTLHLQCLCSLRPQEGWKIISRILKCPIWVSFDFCTWKGPIISEGTLIITADNVLLPINFTPWLTDHYWAAKAPSKACVQIKEPQVRNRNKECTW